MQLTNKQINQLANSISTADILTYIEEHLLEYNKFLEAEKKQL